MSKLFKAKVGQKVICKGFDSVTYALVTVTDVIGNSAPSRSDDFILRVTDGEHFWLRRISECVLEEVVE